MRQYNNQAISQVRKNIRRFDTFLISSKNYFDQKTCVLIDMRFFGMRDFSARTVLSIARFYGESIVTFRY